MEEMFFKLFFVAAIYCAICGLFMFLCSAHTIFDRFTPIRRISSTVAFDSDISNSIVLYWTIGFAVTSLLFFIYIFGGLSDQYFRHYGFLMGTVTILGALAVGRILKFVSERVSFRTASTVGVIFIALCLLLTAPVIFPSPYMYQDSGHIPEDEMHGHATTYEIRDDEVLHSALRRGSSRYEAALLRGDDPQREFESRGEGVPDRFADRDLTGDGDESMYYRNLRGYFDEPAYLFVKERDRTLETDTYQGFRWSDEDFEYLEEEPGIDRIQDNGGYNLYWVEPAN